MQNDDLTPEKIRAQYGIIIAVAKCSLRPVGTFPTGPNGDEDEDSGDEYFSEVIGPAVWRWARANGQDSQANVLVVKAGLSALSIVWMRALGNYLGSTNSHYYIGPLS